MNDWWNDPPEEPELPGCPECDGEADYERDGQFVKCVECGHEWALPYPVEPEEAVEPEIVEEDIPLADEGEKKCPHGKRWGDCGACDNSSDIAFDTARENRIFGR